MDFQLSQEQEMLRDTTQDLLTQRYDNESRLAVAATELGWSRDVWNELAEIGILGLGFDPEESGQIEITCVATEIGRRLAPEPVIHGALAPGALIVECGNDDQRALLDEVAEGQRILAFAHLEPGHRVPTAQVQTQALATADGWVLRGLKNPVLAGDCADTLVVSAALPDGSGTGLFLVDAADVERRCYSTFDSRRAAQINFADTPATPLGEPVDAAEAIGHAIALIQSAQCAEAVGAMEEALRLTAEYLRTRKQFGVTLSKFQTLTQRAADMYISLELARSMSLYAAMSISAGNVDPLISSRAKLQICRSGRHIGQEAIQLHGGIGVTAEYPVGHYTARLTAIENTFGSALDHLQVLSRHVSDYDLIKI